MYTFIFDRYEVTDKKLRFHYTYKDNDGAIMGQFCEEYTLPVSLNEQDETVRYVLQQLHLVVGTSYYKALLGNVEILYHLTKDESDYWNTVYDNGFGEFSYVNQLTDPITPFSAAEDASDQAPQAFQNHGALLGIGGGKDSIVAGELLKRLSVDTAAMSMATRDHHGQAAEVIDVMGFEHLNVERYIDTKIVAFTDMHKGYHGHIPFSAILAWLGVLLAVTTGKRYVVMANEAASSVGNTVWNGKSVNHQWSKSYEFETLTQNFIHTNVSPDIWYFSLIRPYSSLAIIELLVKLGQQYLPSFTSCNLVLRIDPDKRPNSRWCGVCAKCLSSWLLLSVWLDTTKLEEIFSKNLFEDTSLRPLLRELLDLEGHKPLDCVGTSEELRAATRKLLEANVGAPLLGGLDDADIPGPTIDELVAARAPHNIPAELEPALVELVDSLIQ